MFKNIKDILFDKWPLVLSGTICVVLLVWVFGCESETKSLRDPERRVTRSELAIELTEILATSDIRIADLDRQDEIRELIVNQGLIIAQGGALNPLGILTTLGSIFGIGLAADDVRLRRERKGRKYIE